MTWLFRMESSLTTMSMTSDDHSLYRSYVLYHDVYIVHSALLDSPRQLLTEMIRDGGGGGGVAIHMS